jgi:hypothetical protein
LEVDPLPDEELPELEPMLPPELPLLPFDEPLDFLWCFFLLVVPDWPDWSELPELPDCPMVLPVPDWPIELPELPDCPELPDWLESWAMADIEAVRMSANASVNSFFMKSYFLCFLI